MLRPNPNRDLVNKKTIGLCFLCTVLVIASMLDSAHSGDLLRAPQNSCETIPEVGSRNNEASLSVFNKILSAPISFYQEFMSPYWGNRCSHHPSCSRYSLLAIRKHGAIIGFAMTFDRLQHEANEAEYSRLVEINGETKVYDPIENNDFWWYKKQGASHVHNLE